MSVRNNPKVPWPAFREGAPLLAIALAALVLRLWGVGYGLPNTLARPDEARITDNALRMVAERSLDPGDFVYPSLQKYLAAAALEVPFAYVCLRGPCTTGEFVELVDVVHPRLYYRICRLVSVATGVATVFVVFALGRRLTGRRDAALVSALLLAVCYLHVRDSHFATVDVTMTLATTSCLLAAVVAGRTGRMAHFAMAGILVGIAAATKYNAAVVGVAVPVAAWLSWRRGVLAPRRAALCVAVAVGLSTAAFLAAVPYAVPRHAWMLDTLRNVFAATREGRGPIGFELFLLRFLPGGLGWPLFLAAAAGVGWAAVRRRPEAWVWLSFVIVYFVMIGRARWVAPRYAMPVVPLLAIAAADLVFALGARSRALRAALVCLLAAPTLWRAIEFDRVAHQDDTRVQAADWIAKNLPARSRVALCEGFGMTQLHGNRPGRMPFLPRPIPCTPDRIDRLRDGYLVTHEHPFLGWSEPAGYYHSLLPGRWRAIASFSPFRGPARPAYYDEGDAFFVPYAGLGTVERGGPLVTVWERTAGGDATEGAAPSGPP